LNFFVVILRELRSSIGLSFRENNNFFINMFIFRKIFNNINMDSKHMMSYVSIPIDEPIEQNADEEDEESITSWNANLTINQNVEKEGWYNFITIKKR
jgi:hypothetical protein